MAAKSGGSGNSPLVQAWLSHLGNGPRNTVDVWAAQGNKKQRLDGAEHMAVVEEFCMSAKNKWPNVLIQFEDFPTDKAFDILDHMRDKVLCFNGSLLSSCPGCFFPPTCPWQMLPLLSWDPGAFAVGLAQITCGYLSSSLEAKHALSRIVHCLKGLPGSLPTCTASKRHFRRL